MGELINSAPNSRSSQLHPAKPSARNLLPCPRQDFEKAKLQSSPGQPTPHGQQEPTSLAIATATIPPPPRAPQRPIPGSTESPLSPASTAQPGSRQNRYPCALEPDRLSSPRH